jgi:uncharacterized protein with PQ loop repeat
MNNIASNFGNSLVRDLKSQANFNKVPQIFTIFSEKSVSGLSFTSYITEIFSLTLSLAYSLKFNLPYNVYEETLYNLVQSI